MHKLPKTMFWLNRKERTKMIENQPNLTTSEIRQLINERRFDSNNPPQPTWEDAEYHRRQGFRDGLIHAVELIVKLKQAGYTRPQEIANIIAEHAMGDVRQWVREGMTLDQKPVPALRVTPWQELRQAVFERDGRACCYCGTTDALEIDHIEPVHEGGLPVLSNLRVLCCPCNVARNRKTA